MGLPIVWLAIASLGALGGGSSGFTAAMLPTALRETGLLMLWVGVITAGLGLLGAWLVTHFDFPGRLLFEWALILPLAVPTYLAAYSYVEFLGFTGPLQQAVRFLTGAGTLREYWFPDVQSDAGAAVVLSIVLYPYVYVACRAFFLMQPGSINAAARTLGASGRRAFFAITLPISRPAIVVGVTLAMMEVVNDLGAVQYFGINSLTAVIYGTWINRGDFAGAAQLAVTIVLIIAILILAEQRARRARAYHLRRDASAGAVRVRLVGAPAVVAASFCVALLLFGFGVPFGQLTYLALRNVRPESIELTARAGIATVTLGVLGALMTVALGIFSARQAGPRQPAGARGAIRLAVLGYAVPGTVLALGLLQPLGTLDLWFNRLTMWLADWRPGLLLSGSVGALLYVYAIRFLAVSHSTLDAASRKRGEGVLEAGRVLGARGLRLFFRVDLPTLAPAILSAATLVFVEIVKELPATLLLRPIGLETLATVVYGRASATQFAEAALPALCIVLVGLVPVILTTHWTGRRRA
jgi:iron(III) transport system permease protein